MATVFRMSPGAWGRTRFASSWLWETMLAVRALTVRHQQAVHQPWLERIDRRAVGAAAPALAALIPRRAWTPDFLSPPSAPGAVTFEAQLRAVERCPSTRVAEELGRSLASNPSRARSAILLPLLDDPARTRSLLVEELVAAWSLLVAPWADRVGRLLDAEVRRCAELAGRAGAIVAVGSVHASVRAGVTAVVLEDASGDDVEVRCRELVVMPSVFTWPATNAFVGRPPPTLVYPVPGLGDLWSDHAAMPSAPGRVLGRTRAAVLDALAEPATTLTVATHLHLAPATVSEHLTSLRDAGLLRAERRGREVFYVRTALGEALVLPTSAAETRVPG